MSTHLAVALVVGGYPLLRHGIVASLSALSWLGICGETGEAARARQLCEEHRPDLIVLDMELPDGDGLGLLRDFSRLHPAARTLAISEREDAHWLHRIFNAGASGYMSKWDMELELPNGLLQLSLSKERFVSGRMSRLMMEQLKTGKMMNPPAGGVDALSDRELEIFRLMGRRLGTSAVARALGLSVKTIESHHQRIKRKLGVQSGEDLKRRAAESLISAGGKSQDYKRQD